MIFTNLPNINIPGFGGPQNTGQNQYSTTQRIQIVEALCEGPVWGLTEGSASVYFNNSRAIEPEDATFFSTRAITPGTNDSDAFSFEGEITFNGSTNVGSLTSDAPEDAIGTYNEESGCIISVVHTRVDNATLSNITYRAPQGGALIGSWSATLTSSAFNSSFGDKGFTTAEVYATYMSDSAGNFVMGNVTNNGNGTANIVYFINAGPGFTNSQSVNLTFSAHVKVEEITQNSIELLANDIPDSGTYDYSVTKYSSTYTYGGSISPGIDEAKTENLNVQFVNGSAVQNVIRTWGGAGGGVNIPVSTAPSNATLAQLKSSVAQTEGLSLYSTAGYQEGRSNAEDGASSPVMITTDLFPAQQRELIREQADILSFEIKYGRLQALDTEEGGEISNTAIYSVDIAFQDAQGGSFSSYYPVFGSVVHTADFGANLSWQHFIDLGKYRKERGGFHDFKVRIARLTRHIDDAVKSTGADYTGDDAGRYDQSNSTAKVDNIIATVKDNLFYPYTSIAGISFNSTQFDKMPKLSYDMRGRLVKVPTSYTPREYTADNVAVYDDWWEGDFKDELQFTDNPAWVFYDILTNTRYGLGEHIDPVLDIDKYALYRVARYCDELVDDGKGGTEPRFRANLFLTKAEEAYKVIKDMATIFRGILFWMDGQLTPILDAPSDPVYSFTKGNVIDGSFVYQTSGHKTKANQVIVTWNDPDLNFEPTPLIVEDRNAIVKEGKINKIVATAFGCTSEGQAIRYGRWKLWTAQNQTEVVSFQTSLAAAFIRPGDIINVQDADRFGKILSGRTRSSTNNTITLDRSVTLAAGASYTLNTLVTEPAAYNIGNSVTIASVGTVAKGEKVTQAWVDTDENDGTSGRTLRDINTAERASNAWTAQTGGTLISISWKPFSHVEEHTVNTSAGTVSTLTIDGTFDSNPTTQSVWALRETLSNLESYDSTRQYRVVSITQEEDNIYNIAAVEYYPEKYTAVEVDYELGQVPDNIFVGEGVQVPACQYLISREIDNTNAKTRKLSLFWEPPEDFEFIDYYELRHNIPNIQSPIQVRRGETSFEFDKVPQGIYRFSVRIVTLRGNKSPYARTFHQTGLNNSTDAKKIGELYAGGSATSLSGVVNKLSGGQVFRFEEDSYTLSPPQRLGLNKSNNPTNTLSIQQPLGRMVGNSYVSTSTTQHSLTTGSKTFAITSNSLYEVGLELKATSDSNSNNYLIGTITNVGSNNVTINVTSINGSGGDISDWTLNRNGYSSTSWAWETSPSGPLAYIFVDTSRVADGSADCLKLVSRRQDDSGVYMFEDTDYESPWTNISGTCTIDGTTSKVTGSSTSFTTELEVGSFIRFTDTAAARVTFIRNDTELYIDSIFDETITNETTQKNRLNINRAEDFLLGSVTYDATTDEFAFDQFYSISELNVQKQLILDSETAYLLYNDLNEADQQPPEIYVRALAIGYKEPEFKMTWTSTDLAGGATKDTDFQAANYPSGAAPSGGFKQEYNKKVFEEASADPTDNIQYGDGSAITVTCTVREAEDPDNVRKQRTATWTIAKLKRQASGNLARVVKLTAEDYSVVYDAEGANPSFQGSADSDIDLTASTGGFSDPLFRFTLDGTVYEATSGQPWSETSTVPFVPPTSVDSFGTSGGGTKTMLVEVAEKPSGWNQSNQTPSITNSDIGATDSISILGVKTGGSGVFISFSNETHAVACNSSGVPLVGYNNTISGSGTTIEVLVNGAAYEFTTGTVTDGKFGVSITDNADIVEGSITGNGTDIATVGAHAFGANSEDQELLEYTITVGGIADDGSNVDFTKFQTFAKSKGGTAGASSSLVYLYKASSTNPSSTTANLDNTVVDLTTGKIDTSGGDTKFEEGDSGWYTTPSGPTVASNEVLWVVAATANGVGTSDEIAASEWSNAAEFSGESPLNTALVELFLVNNVGTTPDLPDTDVTYTFADGSISGDPGNSWSSTASSISLSNKYLWKTTAAAISQAATSVIDGTDGNDGTDWSTPVLVGFFGEGSTGENAVAVKLTSPDYSIVYDQYDSPSPSGTITLTAEAQNLTTPWFKFTGDGISDDSAFANSNTKDFTVPTTPFTTPKNIQVEVSDGSTTETQQTRLALDTISIAGLSSASDGYTVVNTNSAHTIPVDTGDTDGSTGVYTGSGTTIEVYKGSTQLTPVAASGTPTTGQFTVTATPTNITKGSTESVSSTTKQYTISNASAMSNATASISYAINVENLETLTSIQTFSKSFEGVAGQDNKQLVLGVDHNTFVRQKAGTISPSAIKFTADKINIGTGSPSWSTNPSSVDLFAAATGGSAIDKSTFTGNAVYVRPSAFALSSVPESVSVTANLTYNSVTYTDTESIELLTEASDEITVVLTNDNVSIPANKNGVASSYASTGTTISVFEGSYRLDYDPSYSSNESDETWTVTATESQTGGVDDITVGAINESSGNTKNAVVENASAMPNARTAASITFNVSGKKRDGTEFTATKVQTFSKINTGQDGSTGESVNIIFGRFSTAPDAPADSASPNNNIGWYDNPPSDDGNPLYASRGTKGVDATVFDWGTPYRVDGESVAELYIYSNSITTAAPDLPGTNSTDDSTFNFTTNTLTINGPANTWNLNPPSLGGNGHKVYVSVGLVSGTPGDTSATVSWGTAAVYAQRTDGSTGGSVDLVFKRSATDLSSDAQYIPSNSSGVPSGWSASPPSDDGNPLFASRGTKAVDATNFVWTQPYRVDGESVAEIYIYSDVVTGDSEAVPTGSTYDFTDNTLTINDTNWNKNPPSLSNNGDRVYVSVGLATGTPGATSASVTFGAAALFAEKTDGDTGASVDLVFRRSSTDLSSDSQYIPSASSGVPTDWSASPPSDNGNPLFASRGTKAVGATNFTWTQPYRVDGESVAEIYIYSDVVTGSSEAVPTGSTYDFTSNTLTINDDNWNKNPPSLSSDGDRVYVAVGLASGTPGATAASVTFGSAALFAEKTDGDPSKLVDLSTTKYALDYTSAGTRSAEDLTLTANAQNFTSPVYRFTGGGSAFTNETDFKTANTATFTVPTTFSGTPYTFNVKVKENGAHNNTGITDNITIFSFKATNKQKTVFIFKQDDSTVGFDTDENGDPFNASDQTYASPTNGLESGWSETNPGLASTNGAKVYMSKRIFTDDGLDPQESAWSTPAIVAQRDDGLNTANAEIFALSTTNSAPALGFTDNLTYTFASAKITSAATFGNYTAEAGSVSSANPYLWKRVAAASSVNATVTIDDEAWGSAVLIGTFGDEGDPGDRSKTIRLYATSTATTDSSTGAASLNYADDADRGFTASTGAAEATNLTSSSGLNWQTTSPSPTTSLNVLIAEAVVTQTNSTGNYAKSDGWDISLHAAKIAQDGDRNKTVKLYQLNTSTTATAPGNTEGFNTTSGVAEAITGWAVSPPTPTTTQNVLVAEGVVTQTNATGSYAMTQNWAVSVHAAKVAESIPGDDQGAVQAYGGGGTVTWDNSERAWALAPNGDTTTGAAWPAFAVNSTNDQSWVIELEAKASSSGATSGFYARMQELDSSLSAGKTHISHNASSSDSLVQEDTRQRTFSGQDNAALGNDWTKFSFTYTPTSTAQFVSLVVLNWSGLGSRTLYVRNIKRVVKGPDGADGDISKTVKLYLRSTSSPSAPANDEGFNTTSGAAVSITGSWDVTPPAPTTTQNVYVAEGVVTQTNGTGNFSMTQDWAVSVHAAKQGADGDSGFFYFTRSGTGTGTGTAGAALGPPSSTEVPSPTTGQIAIVQNSASPIAQQGWRYDTNAWQTQDIVTSDIIVANGITAESLQISDSTGTSEGGIQMVYNANGSKILINDGTRTRVKIGYLGS